MSKDEQIEMLETENYELRERLSRREVQDAKGRLQDTMSMFDRDATGQDGEDAIHAAACDYCDAQDDHIKHNDPERWSEMQMGA